MTIPAAAARHFAHEELESLRPPSGRGLLIGRLLEDGDGEDLRGLFSEFPEPEIAAWLARRGARKLSRRSRAFWTHVLGTPVGEPAGAALWPL